MRTRPRSTALSPQYKRRTVNDVNNTVTEKPLDEMTLEELEALVSPKQRRFVAEYEIDGNATEAAIRAKYCVDKEGKPNKKAATATASRLLRNVKIAAYRRARARELYKNLNISAETLALKLNDVFEQSMEGYPHLVWNTVTHQYEPDGTYNFDSRGATKALELMGKSIGMFTENINMTGELGVQIVNDIPKDTG